MLLLMPRLVGRAKRLPIPAALRGLDLAPRHLALLAYLQYDGPLTVSQLAGRLQVAPTTVSLMVGDLSRHGSATAWTEGLAALTPAERATVIATMRAYEAALEGRPGTRSALSDLTATTSSPLVCAARERRHGADSDRGAAPAVRDRPSVIRAGWWRLLRQRQQAVGVALGVGVEAD